MLTFLRLGKKGNLGNQLFQIASTIGLALKNGQEYAFPDWNPSVFLEKNWPLIPKDSSINWEILREKQFHYYDWEIQNGHYSLEGWLQTEKYFKDAGIKEIFSFKKEFEEPLLQKHQNLFTKNTILISVRRGDFVDNKYYFQISYKYYFTALLKHFPTYKDYNIVFTSDDIAYCKKHFGFLPNAYFLEGLSAIEQLCLGKHFSHYIISNSTFSWWLAWLGEKDQSKIIRPIRNFDGPYQIKYNEQDYFPERWLIHNEKEEKIPIKFTKLILKGRFNKNRHQIRNFFKKKYYKFRDLPTDLR